MYTQVYTYRRWRAAGCRVKLQPGPRTGSVAYVLLMLDGLRTGWMTEERSGLGDRATTAVPPCCCTQPQWQQTKGSAIYTGWSCLLRLQNQTRLNSSCERKFLIYAWADLCNVLFLANTQEDNTLLDGVHGKFNADDLKYTCPIGLELNLGPLPRGANHLPIHICWFECRLQIILIFIIN